jgi:hypothetical protein
VKPTKEDRKKFDIDLEYGTIREDKIAEMLTGKKIEVKSEKDLWQKSETYVSNMNHGVSRQVSEQQKLIIGFTTYVLERMNFVRWFFKTDVLRTIVDKLDTFKNCAWW